MARLYVNARLSARGESHPATFRACPSPSARLIAACAAPAARSSTVFALRFLTANERSSEMPILVLRADVFADSALLDIG
jgi:hypothetical protein